MESNYFFYVINNKHRLYLVAFSLHEGPIQAHIHQICVFFLDLVCNCDAEGTARDICDPTTGECICMKNYAGPRCDICNEGYYNFPRCSGNFNTCIVMELNWKNKMYVSRVSIHIKTELCEYETIICSSKHNLISLRHPTTEG